ncbi:MAG: hypothetical protein PWP27_1075 [Clostridiales bacterium]|jgi:hypothetical protein|nr:hypothetical protein [Clostridiales bacterium]MDK2933265.1 hypothetical protein [Clostridiales bacterium]
MIGPIPTIGAAIAATYGLSKTGKSPKIRIKKRKISRPRVPIKRRSFKISAKSNPFNKLFDTILSPLKMLKKEDLKTLVPKLLPPGAKLINPHFPQKIRGAQLVDLDADGKNELIVTYRLDNQIMTSIFKKQNEQWSKTVEMSTSDYNEMNYLGFADINNDGRKELFIGWQTEQDTNDLDIYTWSEQEMSRLGRYHYNRLELIEQPKQKNSPTRVDLALWTPGYDGIYNIELLRWNGSELAVVDQVAPYYARNVVPYYVQKVKQMPYENDNWYFLADAYIKANMPHYTLEAVDTGLLFTGNPARKEKLISLRQTTINNFF